MGKGKENCHRLERSFIHAVLNLSMPCALKRDWGEQTSAGGKLFNPACSEALYQVHESY